MEDVGYLLLMIALVVLAALFAVGCDKIVGPDEPAMAGEEQDESWSSREEAA